METDKRKNLNSNQTKPPGRTTNVIKTNPKKRPENGLKSVKSKETESKSSVVRPESRGVNLSDKNRGADPPEAFETMVIHYVDDDEKRSEEEAHEDVRTGKMTANKQNDNAEVLDEASSDLEKEAANHDKEDVSDESDTAKDSGSSHGDSKIVSTEISPQEANEKVENEADKSQGKALLVEEVKEVDALDEASNGTRSAGSYDIRFDTEENGEHKNEAALEQKIEEMGTRIEKLEEELREVAALEISLYSVVPEHGSSAHKVHTPARRLSRLYIHASKHWTLDKRATIAKNTVSGLILIAKSCSNDVSRLTFWLSNTIVLREIISQAFGSSRRSNPFARFAESNGVSKSNEDKFNSAALKWKGGGNNKQNIGFMPIVDDWQETGTFIGALEKVESWIFSRSVESVWWQALTPYMQTPSADSRNKSMGKLLGPALGDQKQGSFSIELWRNAFQDAFHRLCPVRGGGHDCGCLPVMARMVMKQCVSRLDVAMFNAILRESEHEIPTDPVSDPIVDSKVLPISAGDLSFGSGAQLKNSVGNWTRWLTDAIGMADADDATKEELQDCGEPQFFRLLNELSDLLMLPKDMLMDRSIRKEVCPSISMALVKRILCNFTPDEFCPDPVPGAVLEALNAESIVERRVSGETSRSFPYSAAAAIYSPPSSADVAEKVAEAGEQSPLARSVSIVQRKGYTSDEELEDLDSPLTTIINKKLHESSPVISNGNGNGKHMEQNGPAVMNARYELLREVWSLM